MQSSHNKRSQRFGPYQVGETIGRGTFGKVKIALHETTHVRVALKILPRKVVEATAHSALKIKREIKILKVLRHPHICRLYDVVQTKHDIVLVLEYVSGGELFDYINRRGSIEEHQARMMFQQLAAAVAYCHRYRVTHRDIKPENILLEHDSPHSVKLSDFGLSSITHDGRFFDTSCGTPNYASPEVVRGMLYDGPATDVWSCGVVLYAMLCGCLPFDDDSVTILFKKIRTADYLMPAYLSFEVQDLLRRMLVVDPLHRATMEQVMQHPWLRPNYPPYLLTLHYQAVLETRRFARERALFHEPLDEEIVNVLSVRFQTSPQVIVTNIMAEEEKLVPTMFAVFSEEHPESVRRYPAAVYFEMFSNALDSKLWPTPLEIKPAEVALRDEGHDVYVSYLILTEKKRARLCLQEMDKPNMNMSASSFLQSQSAQGYGSLNAHSLHQVSGNNSFTGSSFKESLTSLQRQHVLSSEQQEEEEKNFKQRHYPPRLNQASFGEIPLSLIDREIDADTLATNKSVNNNSSNINTSNKNNTSKIQGETSNDQWESGYNELAAPFLPLSHKRARHTLLGRHFRIAELPVNLLKTRQIELEECVQHRLWMEPITQYKILGYSGSSNNNNKSNNTNNCSTTSSNVSANKNTNCNSKTNSSNEETSLLRPQRASKVITSAQTKNKETKQKSTPHESRLSEHQHHGHPNHHRHQPKLHNDQAERQEHVHTSSSSLLRPVTHSSSHAVGSSSGKAHKTSSQDSLPRKFLEPVQSIRKAGSSSFNSKSSSGGAGSNVSNKSNSSFAKNDNALINKSVDNFVAANETVTEKVEHHIHEHQHHQHNEHNSGHDKSLGSNSAREHMGSGNMSNVSSRSSRLCAEEEVEEEEEQELEHEQQQEQQQHERLHLEHEPPSRCNNVLQTSGSNEENFIILYYAKDVMPFGNDFMRNGVAFSPSTPHETLQSVYAAMQEEGLLWRPIYNFCFSCVRYPDIKLQVKMYKMEPTLQVVDVKISVQSGMAATDVAMSLLERLRRKALTMKVEKANRLLVHQREVERIKATVSAVDAAAVASVLNEELDDMSSSSNIASSKDKNITNGEGHHTKTKTNN